MADGQIVIDTRLNTQGINQGTKQISSTVQRNVGKPMSGMIRSLGNVLKSVVGIVKGLAVAVVAALGVAVLAIGKSLIDAVRNLLSEFDLLTGSTGERFKALSDSVETLKGSLVNLIVQAFIPLIPYLIELVNWLTEAAQFVTQLVAALFGFESTVGGIMSKAASGAQKAAKAAKGALASFDQLNVLQKQDGQETPEGTTTPGPLDISPEALSLAGKILKELERLKGLWDEFWKDPLGAVITGLVKGVEILSILWGKFIEWVRDNLPFGDVIADILTIIGETVKKLFINFLETIQNIKKNVELIFKGISDFITGIITGDWKLAFQGLVEIVGGVFGVIFSIIEGVLNHVGILLDEMVQVLGVLFAPILEKLGEVFQGVKTKITEAILSIQTTFTTLSKWFMENVFNPIAAGFGSMLTDIKQGFTSTLNGLKEIARGAINNIIDFLNRMVDSVVNGINSIIGAANAIAGLAGLPEISPVTAMKIPKLATGAVIPANASFLAILGDQKNGKNLEAPAAMFEEMLQRAAQSGGGDITVSVPVYLDNEKIYQGQQKVSKRHGKSLIASGAI